MLSKLQDYLVLGGSILAVVLGAAGLYLLVSQDATQIILAIVAAVAGAFGVGFEAQRLYLKYKAKVGR